MPLIAELAKGAAVLANVDLAGIVIGLTGPIKELWEVNLYRAKLEDVNMSFAKLACSLSETTFQRVTFVGSEFDRCLMRKAQIVDCDFSNTKLIVNLDDSNFEGCKFLGAAFSGGKAGAEYGGRRVKFSGCDFSGAIFKGIELRASLFVDCVFKGARFVECDLRGVKVEGEFPPVAKQFEKMDVPAWALKAQ